MDLYSYALPQASIAKLPASPRDSSKLLIYKTQSNEVIIDRFIHLAKYLPPKSFLVMNETKVVPARVEAQRGTDEIEMLILPSEVDYTTNTIKATANKRLRCGQRISLKKGTELEVVEDTAKAFTLKALFDLHKLPQLLLEIGHTPIPHYIEDAGLSEAELRKKYQSIFAKNPGSVAAPTASLHFTNRVFKSLETAGVPQCFVTLHVGLGTFAPVLPEHLATRTLYEEHLSVPKQTLDRIKAYKKQGRLCTAVGTTSTRTLESLARGKTESTTLFILPPFEFQMVDQLITNFHLPNSSLMMLVEAFLQSKDSKRHLKELYAIALENDFRFYSFGDSMLIL